MSKAAVIEQAIDAILADDDNEDEAVVSIHEAGCLSRPDTSAACTCQPRYLLMPPARVADVWWWLRHVDTTVRYPHHVPFT